MKLATSQVGHAAPSTNYSCRRRSVAPGPTCRVRSAHHRRRFGATATATGHQESHTQEAWNRLELITRLNYRYLLHLCDICHTCLHMTCRGNPYIVEKQRHSVCRKLAVAVSEEDYPLAAQLSEEKRSLSQHLPPVSQYTFHQLQELQTALETGEVAQQYLAVKRLGT